VQAYGASASAAYGGRISLRASAGAKTFYGEGVENAIRESPMIDDKVGVRGKVRPRKRSYLRNSAASRPASIERRPTAPMRRRSLPIQRI